MQYISDEESSATFSVKESKFGKASNRYLDQLIFDSKWNEAKLFVEENGRCARRWRTSPQFMNNGGDSYVLPIHLALTREDVPLEFLETLIFAYPECVEKRESFNRRSCVHIAIKSLVPDYIISYLINLHPLAVQEKDIYGRIPLHYAVSHLRSLTFISELIALCPTSVFAQDNRGWSPLHVAAGTFSSIAVVQLLLSRSKDLIKITTKIGHTPLDIAEKSDSETITDIIEILRIAQKKANHSPTVDNVYHALIRNKNIGLVMSETSFV